MNPMQSLWAFLNLPVADAVEKFYHDKSPERVADFAPPQSTRRLDLAPQADILPGAHYVTVTARKTVLAYDRVVAQTFYPVAHSTFALLDGLSEPRTLTSFQTLNPELLNLDSAAGRKLVLGPRTLLDGVPFRGSVIAATVALLAVKASDYSKPLLTTLQKLSDIAGVKYFASAAALAEPLVLGIQGLSEAGGGVQVAYAGNLPLRTGVYLVASMAREGFDWAQYTFAPDFTLLRQGQPVNGESYMALTIEASTQRTTWPQIPELRAASAKVDAAVRAANRKLLEAGSEERNAVEAALFDLQWACLNTPELCEGDGERIATACVDKVRALMRMAAGGLSTSEDRGGGDQVDEGPGFSLEDVHPSWRIDF